MAAGRVRAFIALGSNLGERESHLADARAMLGQTPGLRIVGASRIYQTEPLGPGNQGPYLNAVLEVETDLTPRGLLECLLAIERQGGRRRSKESERWGPRSLDLDLLFHGQATLEEEGLEVPHPRLHQRAFVLEPLCDLAADWIHPRLGVSLETLRTRLEGSGWVEISRHESGGWRVGKALENPPEATVGGPKHKHD